MEKTALQAKNIVKHYGGVIALSQGTISIIPGEVVALVGANGSGKSTLSKIITGVVSKDSGDLVFDGNPVEFANPVAAQKKGITAVYQELSLVPSLSVSENIFLGHEPLTRTGRIDNKKAYRDTEKLLALFEGTFQQSLHPDALVRDLPPDEKQIVEILKAISRDPKLLILDEATASLDGQQVECLFDLILEWKAEGMGLVFVSHRMDEIFRIADRAIVLRNGTTVGEVEIAEIDEKEVVSMMVGHELGLGRDSGTVDNFVGGQTALVVEGLETDLLHDINFSVNRGELVGIGGLRGQGQSDLLHAIFGNRKFTGSIKLYNEVIVADHPQRAMRKDVALIPGDRSTQGVLMTRSILENLHLPNWKKYNFPLRMQKAVQDAENVTDRLSMVMESLRAPISSLSGGNAQKVVIGKWLLRSPRLLLLDDPTKGVDVGTKAEFYNLLDALCQEGTTILLYSSDDQELLDLCTRILVMQDGRIKAELMGKEINKSNLVSASMGAGMSGANGKKS